MQVAELKRAADAEREAQRLLHQSHYKAPTIGAPNIALVRSVAGSKFIRHPSQMQEMSGRVSNSDDAFCCHTDSKESAELEDEIQSAASERLSDGTRGNETSVPWEETDVDEAVVRQDEDAKKASLTAGVERILDGEAKRRERHERQRELEVSLVVPD